MRRVAAVTPVDVYRARALRRQGSQVAAIAGTLGLSKHSVYRVVQGVQCPIEHRGAWQRAKPRLPRTAGTVPDYWRAEDPTLLEVSA